MESLRWSSVSVFRCCVCVCPIFPPISEKEKNAFGWIFIWLGDNSHHSAVDFAFIGYYWLLLQLLLLLHRIAAAFFLVSRLIFRNLIEEAQRFHILIDDVSITHLSFTSEYAKAVEDKQVRGCHGAVMNSCDCVSVDIKNKISTHETPEMFFVRR